MNSSTEVTDAGRGLTCSGQSLLEWWGSISTSSLWSLDAAWLLGGLSIRRCFKVDLI